MRLQGEPNRAGGPPERAVLGPARPRRRPRNRLATAQVRDRVRSVLLSERELEWVTAAARASGMTTAGFLAQAAIAAAGDAEAAEARVAGDRELITGLFAARRHLRQVGNNLNQIAKAVNSGGIRPESERVLAAVQQAVLRVDAAVNAIVR
ncbi:plasmid mobilization protein [Streptomyces profundus]|uniref:plasmid mobilization protein n=1 Tax=Streptomyces profundus TaxID=2867410 RepID=UPI001D16AC4B|nr:plasmid mobilization relaxosome protein MobC [Streptomyces sp. MA3_2.13]UED83177.1 MobC family plasmid mobilization relaxosome protein [Streptomyces sp. MA3_2.13]